jgi:hypothetical protein
MNEALKNPVPLAFAAIIVIGFVYILSRKILSDTVGAVGDAASAVNDARVSLGSSIGETIFEWFNKPAGGSSDLYYTVLFPDGTRHAIASPDVSSDGYFNYQGVRYRMGTNGENTRVAVAQGYTQ